MTFKYDPPGPPPTAKDRARWARLAGEGPGVTKTGKRVRKRPESTPEAKEAYRIYWREVRRGTIRRPDRCERCGLVGRVTADHRDYSRPTVVTHLCQGCHSQMPPAGGTVRR